MNGLFLLYLLVTSMAYMSSTTAAPLLRSRLRREPKVMVHQLQYDVWKGIPDDQSGFYYYNTHDHTITREVPEIIKAYGPGYEELLRPYLYVNYGKDNPSPFENTKTGRNYGYSHRRSSQDHGQNAVIEYYNNRPYGV
ncbi:hypothetical protein BJ684DRAFT_22197 [Piptocephalis cylindrospora]|uniref:Uncharacterized protein n=1 Tax=Piptocephalis cylindrospora TaxID=1907219 RepID=A0A4P9XXS2_9FUNG|nr:hypothetical protein BJ684DRAFT_22197 [Piptocephalis cylindrospora]|eukprot:RKP11253.1 hypothetical protein BJ684DRAFT_22197 [Piptocephalis cylindrospora]